HISFFSANVWASRRDRAPATPLHHWGKHPVKGSGTQGFNWMMDGFLTASARRRETWQGLGHKLGCELWGAGPHGRLFKMSRSKELGMRQGCADGKALGTGRWALGRAGFAVALGALLTLAGGYAAGVARAEQA